MAKVNLASYIVDALLIWHSLQMELISPDQSAFEEVMLLEKHCSH